MLKNKKVRGILQILLSLTLLTWLVQRAGLNEVMDSFSNLIWGWYMLAFFLFLLNVVIRAYRWYTLLHSLNDRPTFGHLAYLYFIGFFANNFIPSGFGGDLVKVVSLRRVYGRGAEALSSVMMDRLTGLLGSALIALIALIWNSVGQMTTVELPPALWTAVALISIGIPASFLIIRWTNPLDFIAKRLPAIQRLPKYNKIEQLVETVNRYPLRALFRSLLTSLPFTLSLIVLQYSIARALSVDLSIFTFALFVPIISIINLLPLSFNGLGVREGVYQFLFVPIGVSDASAIAMSLAFYLLRFSAGLIGGLMYGLQSVMSLVPESQAEKAPK
ncbi:MAG: flippase-like domain-containing protein [Chloroflexi bacterium]|nr:flippase-like domain-containing protein [Chloroflexota bacterium]